MPAPEGNDLTDRPIRTGVAAGPAARGRVGRAFAELLLVVLAAIAGLSALILWHLSRRGRMIRDRLGQPREVRWPGGVEDRDRTDGP